MSQLYVALASLTAIAASAVFIGAHRFRKFLPQHILAGTLEFTEALSIPLNGSVVLLSMYVLLRLIPKNYFITFISFCFNILGVVVLKGFMSSYIKPNILSGIFCILVGSLNFWWGNWIANDILAFILAISSIEMLVISNFHISFGLLIALFFYDIFWVFGTDAMITVATGIDGPIKLLFPNTIFGDHAKKSLLGLGDLVVPGFFISQTLVFSRDFVKRGNFYFNVAVVAYIVSLLNTMGVMLYFQHGQPALLFIVPWLLITFCVAVYFKGDVKAAWEFDLESLYPKPMEEDTASSPIPEESFLEFLFTGCLQFFGFNLGEQSKLEEESEQFQAKKKN